MKKSLLIAVFMLLAMVQTAFADSWTEGAAPGDVESGSEKVVLYNVATNSYVGGSGMWGTQLYMLPSGKFYNVTSKRSGRNTYYQFTFTQGTETRYIGWGNNDKDEGMLFINARSGDDAVLNFTAVTVAGKTNVYNISISKKSATAPTLYLKSNGNNSALGWSTDKPATNDETAQWMIIKESDFQRAFNKAANEADLNTEFADGTNLLKDPIISAYDSEASEWKVSGDDVKTFPWQTKAGKTITSHPAESVDNLNKAQISGSSISNFNPHELKDYNGDEITGNRIYVGEGYGSFHALTFTDEGEVTDGLLNDAEKALITAEDYEQFNKDDRAETYMGKYWTANIHGAANVYQDISGDLAEGWYTITCKGFTNGAANIYATAGGNTVTEDWTALAGDAVPATYALAGKMLQDDGNSHSVTIYVPADATGLRVGVEGKSGWTCFCQFKIIYFGPNKAPYLYFNEEETDVTVLEDQVNSEKHGLYLSRKLTPNQWNSLVLPVNLNAETVKTTFGADTKLAKLNCMEGYIIKYTKVDLTDSRNGIEAGQHYIIRPSALKVAPIPDKGLVRVSKSNKENTVTIPFKDVVKPVYFIRNVIFNKMPDYTGNGLTTPQDADVTSNPAFEGLRHRGTYVWQQDEKTVAPGSFLLSSNTGEWKHTQEKSYAIKGFRTWIDTQKAEAGAKVMFLIDGVEEEGGVVTGIDGLEIAQPAARDAQHVYDLNGRLVRSNGSVEGLAKGIYVVNGKKVVIK